MILEKNLSRICKAEAGKEEKEIESDGNGMDGVKHIASFLKEKTGRDSFSMDEILNPDRTIKIHQEKMKAKEVSNG